MPFTVVLKKVPVTVPRAVPVPASTKLAVFPVMTPAASSEPFTLTPPPPIVSVAPACTVRSRTCRTAPEVAGLNGVPDGMVTSVVAVGTWPSLQLPAVFQLVSTTPVQVPGATPAGQLTVAPPFSRTRPPSLNGFGFSMSITSGTPSLGLLSVASR